MREETRTGAAPVHLPPLEVVEELATEHGVCLRAIPVRMIDTRRGVVELVHLPCRSVLESVCPPCARRARSLRMVQCREGWHLADEPEESREAAGVSAAGGDGAGRAADAEKPSRRQRSTRRRQDAPDLPRRPRRATTVGRVFMAPDGKVFRPSMFITLTLPSYGRVREGAPVDPATYDYRRAARDALHFSKLVDRFVQNLRRVAGYNAQYFATVEPQKRFAPHLHMAVRGAVSRADLRAVVAATYHQVWWPAVDEVRFEGEHLPVWVAGDGESGDYVDPATGEALTRWDEALTALDADPDAVPLHVVRFGSQMDVQGVLAGTPDADQRIRYLAKYLTKSLGGVGDVDAGRAAHAVRLVEALRYEPCSPECVNWLRYGIQPKGAKPGMVPGRCRRKAHRPDHLGYGGRRALVSRRWSKSLGEHRRDRRAWVLEVLGLAGQEGMPEPGRYAWRLVPAGDPILPERRVRLLREVARVRRWRERLAELLARAREEGGLDQGKA